MSFQKHTAGPLPANPQPASHAVAKGIWLALWWGIKWAIIIQLAILVGGLAIVAIGGLS